MKRSMPRFSRVGVSNPSIPTGLVVAGGRPVGVVAFETEVVDFFVNAASVLGVPKSVAAIYGVVFASVDALSFADIESRLKISKGSISQGLRVLRDMGAVKEVSLPGDRTALFAPDLEIRGMIDNFLKNRLSRQLTAASERIKVLYAALPAGQRDESAALRTRLKQLQSWHNRARALLPIAKTFLKLNPG